MNLATTIECYGTSEGVKKAWDTRGRGRKPEMVSLYHGTQTKNLSSIMKKGLIGPRRGSSHNVYLTQDPEEARGWATNAWGLLPGPKGRAKGVILEVRVPRSALKFSNEHPEEIHAPGFTAQVLGEFRTVTAGHTIPPEQIVGVHDARTAKFPMHFKELVPKHIRDRALKEFL